MLKTLGEDKGSYPFEDDQPAHQPNSLEADNPFYGSVSVYDGINEFTIYKQFPY